MALINIIANNTKSINWQSFYHDYKLLELININLFPIPKELGFESDSVGISVHANYTDKAEVIQELKKLLVFFEREPYDFKFSELYHGVEISSSNVEKECNDLLPH